MIPNAYLIIEFLELVLSNSVMTFDGEYFQQFFGLIMGTNVAPILTNIYMALLENELKNKCKSNPKFKSGQFFLNVSLMLDSASPLVFVRTSYIGLKNSMNFARQ